MRNKYASICYVCGKDCPSGEGFFERNGIGGWQVRHTTCESRHFMKLKSEARKKREEKTTNTK